MEIIAAVQETDIEQLAEQIYSNTASLFFPHHLPSSLWTAGWADIQ